MTRLVFGLLALAACGAPAPPTAPARAAKPAGSAPAGAAASAATAPDPAGQVTAPPAAPAATSPPSLLSVFDTGELDVVTITEVDADLHPGCAPTTARTWIVSATDAKGAGATCMGDGTVPPACVMYAGATPEHVVDVMCKHRATTRSVDAPAWATPVLAAMRTSAGDTRWEVTPIHDAVRPAVAIVADLELFVAIRTDAGWLRTNAPLEEMTRLTGHRVIDTTPLTGATSFGVITSSYSGGSESGTEVKSFTVVRPTAAGLEPVGAMQIGQFTWVLAAEDRRKYPKAAGDMGARPHVDVQLTPRLDGGELVLDLTLAQITKQLKGTCKRSPDGDDLDAPCILVDMKALAGRYKLVNGELERAR